MVGLVTPGCNPRPAPPLDRPRPSGMIAAEVGGYGSASMAEIDIGLVGCAGRMGVALINEITTTPGCRLAGAVERADSPALGRDAGALAGLDQLGVAISDDARALFASAAAVIEFSTAESTAAHAELAARHRTPYVIGTTGLDPVQSAAVRAAAKTAAIVWAPNMSIGVNLLLALTERVAAILDPAWDIEIVELHHRHKLDAPSGTALALGRAAASGRKVELDRIADRGRDGMTGARVAGHIGFAALRGGDAVGDHSVMFLAAGERIELSHRASSRRIYAAGAVRAALWLQKRAPGLYGMRDVLGLV